MSDIFEGVGKLGFGLMRLPETDGNIDISQVKKMADEFLAAGFKYFDTAYGYGNGASERAVKTVLTDRYARDRFLLATKMPAFSAASAEEARQMFRTSLERTGAGYFDFYLLHNVNRSNLALYDRYGTWAFITEQKAKGLIRNIGFSFHDKADVLDKLLLAHPEVDFVQLQINYADWEDPVIQSRLCLETARRHGKPVIVMEPVKGGILASPPPAVAELLHRAAPDVSVPSWAVRFSASQSGVAVVLSGMSNLEQLRDNVSYMKDFHPLDADELAVIAEARQIISEIPSIPCTSCRYCIEGCPAHIRIPNILANLNLVSVYDSFALGLRGYGFSTSRAGKASDCICCQACEDVCPQHIHITEHLKKAAELFE